MTAVIDMKAMRYINLLDKVSRVRTRKCFIYNNIIYFAVNKRQVSRAIGNAASNIKKIQEKTGKKVRIIKEADGKQDLKTFVEAIVSPAKLKSIEINENLLTITAGNKQNKASLIGRDKRRYEELKKILQDFFNLDLKII